MSVTGLVLKVNLALSRIVWGDRGAGNHCEMSDGEMLPMQPQELVSEDASSRSSMVTSKDGNENDGSRSDGHINLWVVGS